MADPLLIKVKADDAEVKKLNATLQSHNSTVKEIQTAYNQLTGIVKTNATAQQISTGEWKESTAALQQGKKVIKETNAELTGMAGTIRAARQEKRMFRFAVVELMGAFNGLTEVFGLTEGKSKALTDGLKGGMEAAFGLKFAIDMLGANAALLSTPIAIAVGVVVLLASVFKTAKQNADDMGASIGDAKKSFEDFNDAQLKGAYENYKMQIKLNEQRIKATYLTGQFDDGRSRNPIVELLIGNVGRRETMQKQIDEYKSLMVEIENLMVQRERQAKRIQEKEHKTPKKDEDDYELYLATIEAKNAMRTPKSINKFGDVGSIGDGTRPSIMKQLILFSENTPSKKDQDEAFKKTAKNYQEYLINPLLSGIDQVASAWENQFAKNLNATFRNGKTVMDQFFIGLLAELNRVIERALIMQAIFSLMDLIVPGGGEIAKSLGFTNVVGDITSPPKKIIGGRSMGGSATGLGIASATQAMTNNQMGIHVSGTFVQRGSDMVAVVEHSILKRNTRSMSVSK